MPDPFDIAISNFEQTTKRAKWFSLFGFWGFPFLKKLLGPIGPMWRDVIDPNSITGTPPNLLSDTIRMDGNSTPFSMDIIKQIDVNIKKYKNDVLFDENNIQIYTIPSKVRLDQKRIDDLKSRMLVDDYMITKIN